MPDFTLAPIAAKQTYDLRHRVLRPHQALAEMAYPGDDNPATIHLGLTEEGPQTESGAVVGIVSLYRESMPGDGGPGDWRLRGMAVEPGRQGGGIGAALVRAGLDAVRAAGAVRIWCNARTTACGFYDRVGFTRHGDPFNLPGIGGHYIMWIELAEPRQV